MERNSRRFWKRILWTIIQQQNMECTDLWQRSRRLPLTNRSRMGMACKRRRKLHLCRKQYFRWCSMVYNKYKWYRFKRSKDKAGTRIWNGWKCSGREQSNAVWNGRYSACRNARTVLSSWNGSCYTVACSAYFVGGSPDKPQRSCT